MIVRIWEDGNVVVDGGLEVEVDGEEVVLEGEETEGGFDAAAG